MTANPNLERARTSLRSYYEQWRSLTEAEGKAIRRGQWQQVERLQASKQELQSLIIGATEDLRAEYRQHGLPVEEVEESFRGVLEDLVRSESANAQSLQQQLAHADEQLAELEGHAAKLSQVRQAYVPTRESSWHSYS